MRRFPARPRQRSSARSCYLRQHYHFGPRKTADYLKRFHDVAVAGSSVHRILWRQQMNRLPANQKHRPHRRRWQRYEKPQPGHRLQMDVKFLERAHSRHPQTESLYQFTAIDDCTRIRVLKVFDACNQRTAIRSSSTTSCRACRFASPSWNEQAPSAVEIVTLSVYTEADGGLAGVAGAAVRGDREGHWAASRCCSAQAIRPAIPAEVFASGRTGSG